MTENPISQECERCGRTFLTFDDRIRVCATCFYEDGDFHGRVSNDFPWMEHEDLEGWE